VLRRIALLLKIFAVVALILCALALVFGTSNFQDCVSTDQQPYRAQQTEKGIPGIPVALAYRDCFGKWANDNNSAITAISTLLLFLVTAGLVWVAHRQHTTARAELRAYVFVTKCKVTHVVEGDGQGAAEAVVVIKNAGQTPARGVTNITGFAFDQYPPPPTLVLKVPRQLGDQSRFDLPPGEETVAITSPGICFTDPLKRELAEGKRVIFIYGEIRYRDVFGRDQTTQYRLMMGGPVGVNKGRLIGCKEGNEAT